MALRITPHEPASAPIMISRLFESMKPMPQAARPGDFPSSAAEPLVVRQAAERTRDAGGRYRFGVKARNDISFVPKPITNA